jgi:hypothetical protein
MLYLLLRKILWLLCNKKFGLKEIKREIRDIEKKLDGKPTAGPLTTGPFFVRAGMNNALNVKVQNTGAAPIDVVVRLFSLDTCPPSEIDSETLLQIPGGCCARDAVVTAPAGNFEVVICPSPATATIRAFVSLHSGAATTSAFEYVFRASEMLPVVCELCEVDEVDD